MTKRALLIVAMIALVTLIAAQTAAVFAAPLFDVTGTWYSLFDKAHDNPYNIASNAVTGQISGTFYVDSKTLWDVSGSENDKGVIDLTITDTSDNSSTSQSGQVYDNGNCMSGLTDDGARWMLTRNGVAPANYGNGPVCPRSDVTISPTTGPAKGGEEVTVSAALGGLPTVTSVDFRDANGDVVASVRTKTTNSDGLTFDAPDLTQALHSADNAKPGTTEIVTHLVAHTSKGKSIADPDATYTAAAPDVSGVIKPIAAMGGGEMVQVHGKYLTGASAIDFHGNNQIVSAPVTVVSDTDLDFRVPNMAALVPNNATNLVNVDMYVRTDVTNQFGALLYSNRKNFDVIPLSVTGVSPAQGPVVGGNDILVSGTAFTKVSHIDFVSKTSTGGTQVRASVPVSPTSNDHLTVKVPDDTVLANGSPGRLDFDLVAVGDIGGQQRESSATASSTYAYKLPDIHSISVGSHPIKASGGARLVLQGTDFDGVERVLFNANGHNVPVTANVTSNSSLYVDSPDLSSELKASGQKQLHVDITLEIPVKGTSTGVYLRSGQNANSYVDIH